MRLPDPVNAMQAENLLAVEPVMYNHFIDISDGQSGWEQHQERLNEALSLLCRDEPFSLRHMNPPPLWTETGSDRVAEWYEAHPDHPMADDDRARARRRAAGEILLWARFVPQAFSPERRKSLNSLLLDCDASVRFDLVRAVGFLGDREAIDALEELARIEPESDDVRDMCLVLLRRFGHDEMIPG